MPIHDWKRVKPGISHDFHSTWIIELKRRLNAGVLPDGFYALAEQQAAGFGADVLTLQSKEPDSRPVPGGSSTTGTLVRPHGRFTSETEGEFYRRKKSSVVIRHVSDDRIVAMLEIMSPGNKATRKAFREFLDKVTELPEYKVHLLIVDLIPSLRRAPDGIHAAIWQELVDGAEFHPPADKPLTLAAYESDQAVKAYVEPVAVGDVLPAMPLILEPGWAVDVPLEATYQAAWDAVPRRWQQVLED